MRIFIQKFPDLAELTVLDVGGRPFIWDLIQQEFGVSPKRLVLLNYSVETTSFVGYESVVGDGTCMKFKTKEFDLVFSNSVIEHVGKREEMRKFAAECRRVGQDFYIQTPNRWFPIEPHLVAVFIHWLPRKCYRALSFLSVRYISLRRDHAAFYNVFEGVELLNKTDLEDLFPGVPIMVERFMGLAKSFTVSSK